jgi:hypothetical protein
MQDNEDKTEEIESDIVGLNREVSELTDALNEMSTADMNATIQALVERVRYLEKAELENSVHSRKYNLMLHGVDGTENDNELTEQTVRQLMVADLKLDEQFSKNVMIGNCHRLPKPSNSTWGNRGDPDSVVVKFIKWSDREKVLRAAKNLNRG